MTSFNNKFTVKRMFKLYDFILWYYVPNDYYGMPYQLGENLDATINKDNIGQYLLRGWELPETYGTWSVGNESTMRIPLASVDQRNLRISVEATPYITKYVPRRKVDVYINDQKVDSWVMSREAVYQATIPSDIIKTDLLTIKFIVSKPDTAMEKEHRALGIFVKSIQLDGVM